MRVRDYLYTFESIVPGVVSYHMYDRHRERSVGIFEIEYCGETVTNSFRVSCLGYIFYTAKINWYHAISLASSAPSYDVMLHLLLLLLLYTNKDFAKEQTRSAVRSVFLPLGCGRSCSRGFWPPDSSGPVRRSAAIRCFPSLFNVLRAVYTNE